jgi:hypothetical protein
MLTSERSGRRTIEFIGNPGAKKKSSTKKITQQTDGRGICTPPIKPYERVNIIISRLAIFQSGGQTFPSEMIVMPLITERLEPEN